MNAPWEPSSLVDYLLFYRIDPKANPNTNDAKPGDSVCADALGLCSLRAAFDVDVVFQTGVNISSSCELQELQQSLSDKGLLKVGGAYFLSGYSQDLDKILFLSASEARTPFLSRKRIYHLPFWRISILSFLYFFNLKRNYSRKID